MILINDTKDIEERRSLPSSADSASVQYLFDITTLRRRREEVRGSERRNKVEDCDVVAVEDICSGMLRSKGKK